MTKERIEGGEHGWGFVQRYVPKPMLSIQDCETLHIIQPCRNFLNCGQGVVLEPLEWPYWGPWGPDRVAIDHLSWEWAHPWCRLGHGGQYAVSNSSRVDFKPSLSATGTLRGGCWIGTQNQNTTRGPSRDDCITYEITQLHHNAITRKCSITPEE